MAIKEIKAGQGPNLWSCNNNLITYLFLAFSYNEFWEGDKSFNNSLSFLISKKDLHCISGNKNKWVYSQISEIFIKLF